MTEGECATKKFYQILLYTHSPSVATRQLPPQGALGCADSNVSARTKSVYQTRRGDHNSAVLRVTNKFVLVIRSGAKQLKKPSLDREGGPRCQLACELELSEAKYGD